MKKPGVVLVVMAILAAVSAFVVIRERQARIAPLVLPDGSLLKVVGVTYGTNHQVGTLVARAVAKFPRGARQRLRAWLGDQAQLHEMQTSSPELRVWYQAVPNPGAGGTLPNLSCTGFLADEAGFASGPEVNLWIPNAVVSAGFIVHPRRSRTLEFHLFHYDQQSNPSLLGKFRFSNPAFVSTPAWQPDSLPCTRTNGDLHVTLEKFSTGHSSSTTIFHGPKGEATVSYAKPRPGDKIHSAYTASLRSSSNTNEDWAIASVRVSDATGNVIQSSSFGSSFAGKTQAYHFYPSLWPGEAAWKLQLETKLVGGFSEGDLFSFRDVPLPDEGKTNQFALVLNRHGVSVTLTRVVHQPEASPSGWSMKDSSRIDLKHTPIPEGTSLDLVSVVTDLGERPSAAGSLISSEGDRTYSFRGFPPGTKTLDISFALHQTRKVEFLVRPDFDDLDKQPGRTR